MRRRWHVQNLRRPRHHSLLPRTTACSSLDGANSYVQLPPKIFDLFTQATVEGWVRWDSLGRFGRFFDFGDRNRETYVRNDEPGLVFMLSSPDGTRNRVGVAGILHANEWCHIAAVSGPGGQQLFFNGELVGSNSYAGSFSGLTGLRNLLGKENFGVTGATTLKGAIDELRVWDHRRTPEQIRENMFRTLTGEEPGLAGYWNFDDGTAKDRSAGKHDAALLGNARIAETALPAAGALRIVNPAWLSGKVTRSDGGKVADLEIFVTEGTRRLATLRTDQAGEYRVSVVSEGAVELSVVTDGLGGGEADLNLTPGETRTIDLPLKPTRLAGRVLDSDGKPRQGVRVELTRTGDKQPATDSSSNGASQTVLNSASNAQGEFLFDTPLPGQYVLSAVLDDGSVLFSNGKPVEMKWGATLTDLEIKLPAATTVLAMTVDGPAKPGRVLHLTGDGSFAELPPDIFTNLHEVTVEGWVKWERFAARSRFFDFGEAWHSINVKNDNATGDLVFDMIPAESRATRHQSGLAESWN